MFFFFITALFIALFLEGTVTTLPLVLIVLLCLTIYRRDAIVFPVAFVSGIILDILIVQTIGVSSLFFAVMICMILLYQRKYEINSYPFVFFASLLGSFGYLLLFERGSFLIDGFVGSIIALLFFASFRFFNKDLKSQSSNLKFTSQMSKF